MQLTRSNADIFVHKSFKRKNPEKFLSKTTHFVVGAHQDDIEIMGFHAIQECYKSRSKWMTGVILTDGRGSPRSNVFKKYPDAKMIETRRKEQIKAAEMGDYL